MKKLVLLLLVLVMAFVGCGKEETTVANQNDPMIQAVAELKSYLEKSENKDFFGQVSGGVEVRELNVTVDRVIWRFMFTSSKTSVTFSKGTAQKTYSSVQELIKDLEEIKKNNNGKYTLEGNATYTDAYTIVVKFKEIGEKTITLSEALLDGQKEVVFIYEGREYRVVLETAYVDMSKYEGLNIESATAVLQRANSSFSLNTVTKNITFPLEAVINNVTYKTTWESSDLQVLTNEGLVTRPTKESGDKVVNVKVTFEYVGPAQAALAKNQFLIPVTIKAMPEQKEGYSLEIEVLNQTFDLKADGSTVMEVRATLIGQEAANFAGSAQFTSLKGLKSQQEINAFYNGQVRFNVTLPNRVEDVYDSISVAITKVDNNGINIVGLKSEELSVKYIARTAEGGAQEDNNYTYQVAKVASMDLADRVAVYVGGVRPGHEEIVKTAILDQVKLYSDHTQVTTTNEIELVEIIKEVVVGTDANGNKSYAFVALTKLPIFNDIPNYTNRDKLLKDNQKNFWEVKKELDTKKKVVLDENDNVSNNYFNLIDRNAPTVSKIVSFNDDINFLPSDSLMVVFSEPVSRETAERPENYKLNAKELTIQDIEYIRVLDTRSQEDSAGEALLDFTGVDESLARNTVIIQLKRSFARSGALKVGENLLQINKVTDWAGLTDLSDNNEVNTQNMPFGHNRPFGNPDITITSESPEQFVVVLDGIYPDIDSRDSWVLSKSDITVSMNSHSIGTTTDGSVTLTGFNIDEYTITHSSDFKTTSDTAINTEYREKYGDDYYVVELTKDHTQLTGGDRVYHNRYFRIEVNAKKYDAFGNEIEVNDLARETLLIEDNDSPKILVEKILDTNDKNETTTGRVWFKTSEPTQLFNVVDSTDVSYIGIKPGITPNTDQSAPGQSVPVPAFEYQKTDEFGNLVKVTGELEWVEDLHDMDFIVTPVEKLSEGTWELVVSQISDDAKNNSDTIRPKVTVKHETDVVAPDVIVDYVIDPYIVWAAAINDIDNSDWVYILYSREMNLDTIRVETYDINGKQLKQGADITTETRAYYKKNNDINDSTMYGTIDNKSMYKGYLVKIKLPVDFLTGDDLQYQVSNDDDYRKNMLTVPRSLRAIDDGVEKTSEVLLFDNNNNENQYELLFMSELNVGNIDNYILDPATVYYNDIKTSLGI